MSILEIFLMIIIAIFIPITIITYVKYWKHHRYGGKFKDNFPDNDA